MGRILQIGSVLLLVVGASYAGAQQEPKAPPKPPKPAPAKPAPAKGGAPKAIPKGSARLLNPGNVAVRLFRMTPEERERALEKLPNEQARENARKTLQWFDSLPKETQELQLRRLEHFSQLPPEKRAEVKQLVVQANQLPPPRKAAVGRALVLLQQMNDIQREVTLQRPGFQARFSPEEFRIVSGLADASMGPLQ